MRPPIKEHLGVAIGYGGAGGYYVELSLDGLLVAAGLHSPAPDQLGRFRAAIDSRRAAAFERAVKTAGAAGLTLAEPELKRAPRGYPIDHPRIDRLRLKELTLHRRHALEPWLHEPGVRHADPRRARGGDAVRPLAGRPRRALTSTGVASPTMTSTVNMLLLHGGTPRDLEAREQLAAALPGATVGEPDDVGTFEVTVEADDQETALDQVWNAVAASGTDDHIVFLEHADLPEHWRRRSRAAGG